MLGTKNTWNSEKCSLALPLQHCNSQHFDILEIGITQAAGNEMGFKHVIPERISVEDWRSSLSAVYRRPQRRFLMLKMSF